MITGWIAKVVLGIAIVAFAAVELGSPIIVRAQLDDRAHDAANDAVHELRETQSVDSAKAAAKEVAGDTLEDVVIADGKVTVKLEKIAKSYVLREHVKRLRTWYDVTVTATAP